MKVQLDRIHWNKSDISSNDKICSGHGWEQKKQTCSLEKNKSEQATVIFKKYPAEFLRAECKILQFS